MAICSVSVEYAADSLENPVGDMLVCLQVGLKHQTDTHRVTPSLCHITRSSERASQLEFVGLDWNDLDDWHFFNQNFWHLVVKTVLIDVPASTLNEHALDVASLLKTLRDVCWVALFRNHSV